MDPSFCFFVSLSDLPRSRGRQHPLPEWDSVTRSPRHISYLTFDPRPSLPVLPHRSAERKSRQTDSEKPESQKMGPLKGSINQWLFFGSLKSLRMFFLMMTVDANSQFGLGFPRELVWDRHDLLKSMYVGFRNSGCSVEFKVLPGTQAIEHVENRWTCTYPKKAIFFRFSLWFFLPFPNRCVKFVCVFLISLVVDSRPRTCTVTHVFLFGNIKNVQTHYQGKTWMQSKFLKFCPTSLNFATLPVIFQRLGIFFTSSQIPYMTTFLKFRHYIQHPSLVPTTNL